MDDKINRPGPGLLALAWKNTDSLHKARKPVELLRKGGKGL